MVESYIMIIAFTLLHHQETKLIVMDTRELVDEEHVKFSLGRDFARSYYRDEIKAKGLNPDFHVAINNNYDKRSPSYYTMESQVNKFTGHETSSNDNKTTCLIKMSGKKISN